MDDLDEGEAERAVESFNKHFRSEVFRYPVDDQTLDLACALVSRHALRAYDAVQARRLPVSAKVALAG